MNADERRARLNQVLARGMTPPTGVYAALDSDVPPPEVRAWSWWSAIWPRPSASLWTGYETSLRTAQDSWDASERHVQAMDRLAAERQARGAAQQAERDAEHAAAWQVELDRVTADLRRAYLSQPGTTEASFEKALPELLEQRAREATLATAGEIESPLSTRQILTA